ncbi:MAG TPA: phosphatase [Cryomorphaceae bacterium]|mgnify:CR=1 FL=1|nr:phosphatase [Owenweeksia sp.]HAD98627.1 phosphatase [Cryomorphaceae bacterium]|tara:strand:- start:3131 stop:4948 length:1818 start_codon:yes stop_codon:yes gene_type:complete
MKKFLLGAVAFAITAPMATAQIKFDPEIDTAWTPAVAKLPASPLKTQVLFVGGVDKVQTPAIYGNAQGEALAKQWHDFIGFTPDNGTSGDLGWISVNHEMVVNNDSIGDGGGMTVFKVKRDPSTDSLIIVNQTLTDGRSGKFFAVDFVNTTGETGMNCGGISAFNGRIWTAEEWFQSSNAAIYDNGDGISDTSDFVIGTSSSSGFPGFNGQSIKKVQNLNYMVEIDPIEAKAIRKQYNWGRQAFEGGTVMSDNKTVYLGVDDTPGFFTKFVATTAGDFTSGTTYVYKHDGNPSKWVAIDNTNLNKMLNYKSEAVAAGATMFNRLEWVTNSGGKVYFTETGRANPGGRWSDEHTAGAVHAPHHVARAAAQSVSSPDDANYVDYYGRVLVFDPATENVTVHLEGGPDFATSPTIANYPDRHLSNPDGLNTITINGQDYLLICEDLNQTDFGSTPAGVGTTCELYLLDLSIAAPTVNDLVRIAVVPKGAEVTGAIGTPDGKTVLVNVQHPDASNPFPYNNSLTLAITGWDQAGMGVEEVALEGGFTIFPNPVARELHFSRQADVAIYNNNGQRIRVYRGKSIIDVSDLASGVYYLQNEEGQTVKFIVE